MHRHWGYSGYEIKSLLYGTSIRVGWAELNHQNPKRNLLPAFHTLTQTFHLLLTSSLDLICVKNIFFGPSMDCLSGFLEKPAWAGKGEKIQEDRRPACPWHHFSFDEGHGSKSHFWGLWNGRLSGWGGSVSLSPPPPTSLFLPLPGGWFSGSTGFWGMLSSLSLSVLKVADSRTCSDHPPFCCLPAPMSLRPQMCPNSPQGRHLCATSSQASWLESTAQGPDSIWTFGQVFGIRDESQGSRLQGAQGRLVFVQWLMIFRRCSNFTSDWFPINGLPRLSFKFLWFPIQPINHLYTSAKVNLESHYLKKFFMELKKGFSKNHSQHF